jgi:hypothetical protein
VTTQLTTETATITTAAIQIRTLTIGRKQVTLAVFRQLREEPLIAEDGTLNGVPWGTVNYHPDKCGDGHPHWHVVWQRGHELLRSRVEQDPYSTGGSEAAFRCPEADQWLTAYTHEWLSAPSREGESPLHNPLLSTGSPGAYRRRYAKYSERPLAFQGVRVVATASEAAVAAHRENACEYPSGPFERGTAKDFLDIEVAAYDASLAELEANLRDVVAEERSRRQVHRETRAALAQLPHLFIAV